MTQPPDRRAHPREFVAADAPLPGPVRRWTVRTGFLVMAGALALSLLCSAFGLYYAAAASRAANAQAREAHEQAQQTDDRLAVLEADLEGRRQQRDAEKDAVDRAIERLRDQLAADRAAGLARLCNVLASATAEPGDPATLLVRLRQTYCK